VGADFGVAGGEEHFDDKGRVTWSAARTPSFVLGNVNDYVRGGGCGWEEPPIYGAALATRGIESTFDLARFGVAPMTTVSLSSSDLQALRAVNDALLDPLSHDTTEAWLLQVCARFQALCHAPAGFAVFSFTGGAAGIVSRELPQKYLDRMAELTFSVPGRIQGGDGIELIMHRLRSRISSVATTAELLIPGVQVDDLQDLPMFRDVAFPLALPGSTLLFHAGASGEFMMHAAYPEIEREPFGAATQAVMAALLPAFAASVGALARLGNARRAIAAVLEVLDDGAVVFDSDGQHSLARNRSMSALVRDEPDRAGLERAVHQAALAAAWPTTPKKGRMSSSDPRALSRGWRSMGGIPYRLRAVRLPAGSLAAQEAILVLVQRVGPLVPPAAQLMQQFGLTRREADVARLLAYGWSDREIAADLGLSAHTVRHHAEAVFVKTGVNSRKALALHLGSGLRPGQA
jgi:DNA-binding CsgD family transcriptional regulator